MLKELRGSDVIIECLQEQGVDTVFGYPGGDESVRILFY